MMTPKQRHALKTYGPLATLIVLLLGSSSCGFRYGFKRLGLVLGLLVTLAGLAALLDPAFNPDMRGDWAFISVSAGLLVYLVFATIGRLLGWIFDTLEAEVAPRS